MSNFWGAVHLKDYPQYHFYLSDFRQGSDLCRLYETEDDESEE